MTAPRHWLTPAGLLSLYWMMAGLGRYFGCLLKDAHSDLVLIGAAILLPHLIMFLFSSCRPYSLTSRLLNSLTILYTTNLLPLKVAFTVCNPALVAIVQSYIGQLNSKKSAFPCEIDPPDPNLCNLHLAVARISAASGAAEVFDKYLAFLYTSEVPTMCSCGGRRP